MLRASICTRMVLLAAVISGAGACGGDGSSADGGVGNRAPVISGVAPSQARVDEPYTFRPIASDPDGDPMSFSATGMPAWASLNAQTGELLGTPQQGEEGAYAGIRISVSDGRASASLGPFTVTVNQDAAGSATVSWMPPSENADGTPLTDLMGFRIEYGRDRDDLSQCTTIDNPSITTYLVEHLSAGTWYFAVVAINARGIESAPSILATKIVG